MRTTTVKIKKQHCDDDFRIKTDETSKITYTANKKAAFYRNQRDAVKSTLKYASYKADSVAPSKSTMNRLNKCVDTMISREAE